MPINFSNYAQRRMADSSQDRGGRMRQLISQQARQPNVNSGGGGSDRRNRGTATTSASGGSVTVGNVNPEVKATISSRGGQAIADASGKSGQGGTRNPVSFATYASQREPLRSPAPSHDVPGYHAAVGKWQDTVRQVFDARNTQHRDATAAHDQRMRDYNNAVRNVANSGHGNGGRDRTMPMLPTSPGGAGDPVDYPVDSPAPTGGTGGAGGPMDRYPMPAPTSSLPTTNAQWSNPRGWAGGAFPGAATLENQFVTDPNAAGKSFQQWVQANPGLMALIQQYGLNFGDLMAGPGR